MRRPRFVSDSEDEDEVQVVNLRVTKCVTPVVDPTTDLQLPGGVVLPLRHLHRIRGLPPLVATALLFHRIVQVPVPVAVHRWTSSTTSPSSNPTPHEMWRPVLGPVLRSLLLAEPNARLALDFRYCCVDETTTGAFLRDLPTLPDRLAGLSLAGAVLGRNVLSRALAAVLEQCPHLEDLRLGPPAPGSASVPANPGAIKCSVSTALRKCPGLLHLDTGHLPLHLLVAGVEIYGTSASAPRVLLASHVIGSPRSHTNMKGNKLARLVVRPQLFRGDPTVILDALLGENSTTRQNQNGNFTLTSTLDLEPNRDDHQSACNTTTMCRRRTYVLEVDLGTGAAGRVGGSVRTRWEEAILRRPVGEKRRLWE
jgi:hypothetical protein